MRSFWNQAPDFLNYASLFLLYQISPWSFISFSGQNKRAWEITILICGLKVGNHQICFQAYLTLGCNCHYSIEVPFQYGFSCLSVCYVFSVRSELWMMPYFRPIEMIQVMLANYGWSTKKIFQLSILIKIYNIYRDGEKYLIYTEVGNVNLQ